MTTTNNSIATDKQYYAKRVLSFSTVRQFAQNPRRAYDNWTGKFPWFDNNKALIYGSYVHAYLQDELVGGHENVDHLKETTPDLFRKDGKLYSAYAQAEVVAQTIAGSKAFQWIVGLIGNDNYEIHIEKGLTGEISGVPVKGKPDVYVVDKKRKHVYVFDFKSSASYSASGKDWITLIDGSRRYGSVAWDVAKLFPWQASVYIELLRQNGYADYKFTSRYFVGTKQDVPRFDIWTLNSTILAEGYAQFVSYLTLTDRYLKGELDMPTVADDSQWYNEQTHLNGNSLIAEPLTEN